MQVLSQIFYSFFVFLKFNITLYINFSFCKEVWKEKSSEKFDKGL